MLVSVTSRKLVLSFKIVPLPKNVTLNYT